MTKLFLRMENDNMSAVAADPQGSMAVESNARVDAEAVTAAAADVTSVDTGIDDAMEAEGEVAAAASSMSEAVGDGDGLSPREAEMVEARLERAARLVGADLNAMGLTFRRESFGGRGSRLAVTKMRLEAAEGFGKRIWEAIVKGWEWLKDAVKNLFNRVTKSAESQVERFKTLKTRVSEIKGEKKESKMKAAASVFSIAGVTSMDTIKAMEDAAKGYFDLYEAAVEKLSQPGKTPADLPGADPLEVLKTAFRREESISVTDVAKDGAKAYGRFPGGRSIVVTQTDVDGVVKYKFTVAKIDEKIATDYESFSDSDLGILVTMGSNMAGGLKLFKTAQPKIEKLIDINIKYIVDIMDAAGKDLPKEKKEEYDEILKGFRARVESIQSLVKVMTSEIPTSFFNLVSGVGDVVQAGIGNFKEKS